MVDKKAHIIQAAIELFAEKGFEGTSIRELAAKADVNIAMINYYFGSKEKLFETMVEHKAAYVREQLEGIVGNKDLTEIQKIDAIIESYVERFLTQHKYHRVIHHELMLRQREVLHDGITAIFKRNKEIMRIIIDDGMKKKIFRKVDPELSIASMIGTINQVLLSKSMCRLMLNEDKPDFDPYTDMEFRERLIKHIKQLMHAHLLNK